MTPRECCDILSAHRACVIVPTYNNAATIVRAVSAAAEYCRDVIVVSDGSTDGTAERLAECGGVRFTLLRYTPNRGKGHALRYGFRHALQAGFDYAVTMDADCQHKASDLPLFAEALERHPHSMIVGSRRFGVENMPAANTFANRFSNFWFRIQTLRSLPDTQTGYRLYPIARMKNMRFVTRRYEAELEMLVRAAWRGIPIVSVPIDVYYPPAGQRVSHFRRGRDFARISALNALLCVAALVYGYPSMSIHKILQR